jgi:hypothetical protein
MKTTLNFEDLSTKKFLTKLDFEFFLKQNILKEKYSQEEIDRIYSTYKLTTTHIERESKNNKKQFNYYAEGQVRKMFTGGFLPALFELDEGRKQTFLNFDGVGESWAYFYFWQKYHPQLSFRQ